MIKVPFFLKLFAKNLKELTYEVNDFVIRRGLDSYQSNKDKYRLCDWGTKAPIGVACNLVFWANDGTELKAKKRFTGVNNTDDLLVMYKEIGKPVESVRCDYIAEARRVAARVASILHSDNVPVFIYDTMTGLVWLRQDTQVEREQAARVLKYLDIEWLNLVQGEWDI